MPPSVLVFLLQHLNRTALRFCVFFDRLNGCAYGERVHWRLPFEFLLGVAPPD